MKILIAEDGTLFREGLEYLINNEEDSECIGSTDDGLEAIELAYQLNPDIIIIGIFLRKMDGIHVVREIKVKSPDVGIIVLTRAGIGQVSEAVEAGADAFLPKSSSFPELMSAIRAVHLRAGVFDSNSMQFIRERLGKPSKTVAQNNLNKRELETIKLVACGLSNKVIAQNLNMAERTVGAHLSQIYLKLGVGSRVEAVLETLRRGWFRLEDFPRS